jgi:hypothetical protein
LIAIGTTEVVPCYKALRISPCLTLALWPAIKIPAACLPFSGDILPLAAYYPQRGLNLFFSHRGAAEAPMLLLLPDEGGAAPRPWGDGASASLA